MNMHKENFEIAMALAIDAAKKKDKASKIKESIFTAGLREVLEASNRGEKIEVVSR